MSYRQHHKEGKLLHGLSSSKYKIKLMRRQSQRLQDICPTDRGARFLCLVTCYRLPHRPTGKGPTASGEICPKRLLPTEQCLRDDVSTQLGHTTTKKRQCKNHHALQDQANLVDITPDPPLRNARTASGNPQQYSQLPVQKSVYQNSFFPATIVLCNRLPQHVVEQPTLECFQSALGQRTAIN